MSYIFLIKLAFANIISQKLRAFLTIGGIGLSAGIMVVLLGIGAGLQLIVTEQVSQSEYQNVLTVNSKNTRVIRLDQETISAVKSISGVTTVEQSISLSGHLKYHGTDLTLPLYGVSNGYFDSTPIVTLAGDVRSKLDGAADNIIVSNGALKAFNIDQASAVGRKIMLQPVITKDIDPEQAEGVRMISEREFTIAGVVDKGSVPTAYIPAEYLFSHGADIASQIKAQVAYPEKMAAVRETIEQMGLQTTSIKDTIDQVNRIFDVIQNILVVFGLITLAIAVIGTFNTITIELVQQTKQIGFLRILGIRRRDVGLLFIMESIILATAGVLTGIATGLLVGAVINGLVRSVTDDISTLQIANVYQIPTVPIIIMLILAIGLGWAVGIVPSRRAVNIKPLEALKT